MLFKYEIHVFKLTLNYIMICSLTSPLRLPFTFFHTFYECPDQSICL